MSLQRAETRAAIHFLPNLRSEGVILAILGLCLPLIYQLGEVHGATVDKWCFQHLLGMRAPEWTVECAPWSLDVIVFVGLFVSANAASELMRLVRLSVLGKPAGEEQVVLDQWRADHAKQHKPAVLPFFVGREWLFDEIVHWQTKHSDKRALLIEGESGSGKTSILQALAWAPQFSGQVLAYHFCRSGDRATLTPHVLLRDLVCSLDEHSKVRGFRAALLEHCPSAQLEALGKDNGEVPVGFLETAVLKPLEELHRHHKLPALGWILIDALDEPADFAELNARAMDPFVELVRELIRRLPPWLGVIATCRPGRVPARLTSLTDSNSGRALNLVHTVVLRNTEHQDDLMAYVDGWIRREEANPVQMLDPAVRRLAGSLKQQISSGQLHNFQLLRLLLGGIGDGRYRAVELTDIPPDLNTFYYWEFASRRYPMHNEARWEEFEQVASPVLAVLVAAGESFSSRSLKEASGVPDFGQLDELAAYLPSDKGPDNTAYRLFAVHKSFKDWLSDRKLAREYFIDQADGHRLLAEWCWREFLTWAQRVPAQGRPDPERLIALAQDEAARYMLRHGVDHLISAGRIADAVRLLQVMHHNWDEARMAGTPLGTVSLGRLTRTVLSEIPAETEAQRKAAIPLDLLVPLLLDFYETSLLEVPISLLLREQSPEQWENTLRTFLGANNYVLRVDTAAAMADACRDGSPSVTEAKIRAYFDHDDVNYRELASYIVNRLLAADRQRMERSADYIELLAGSEFYALRSALGDLLLNCLFERQSGPALSARNLVRTPEFWEPVWELNQLDIADLDAADSFVWKGDRLEVRVPRPVLPNPAAEAARTNFEMTEALRQDLLGRRFDNEEDSAELRALVRDFYELGRNSDQIWDAADSLRRSKHLQDLMRLLFAHRLWYVAEEAASVLSDIIQKDDARAGIPRALLSDADWPYWRVHFGAIETTYLLATSGRDESFKHAVLGFWSDDGRAEPGFYGDANARVRALCAENTVAYILDRPPSLRGRLLSEFEVAVKRWLADSDAWVLEHMFRLLGRLEQDGEDCNRFFPGPMPELLDGLAGISGGRGWSQVSRTTFLRHIEAWRRASLSRRAAASSS